MTQIPVSWRDGKTIWQAVLIVEGGTIVDVRPAKKSCGGCGPQYPLVKWLGMLWQGIPWPKRTVQFRSPIYLKDEPGCGCIALLKDTRTFYSQRKAQLRKVYDADSTSQSGDDGRSIEPDPGGAGRQDIGRDPGNQRNELGLSRRGSGILSVNGGPAGRLEPVQSSDPVHDLSTSPEEPEHLRGHQGTIPAHHRGA